MYTNKIMLPTCKETPADYAAPAFVPRETAMGSIDSMPELRAVRSGDGRDQE